MKVGIRGKLVTLFTLFGVLPAVMLTGMFLNERSQIDEISYKVVGEAAARVMDTIDRNLFERYGDVQAFAANNTIRELFNGGSRASAVDAMNTYVSLYAIYSLMVVVDKDGHVISATTKAANGKDIDTSFIYSRNYADADWFKKAVSGEFLKGSNGLTGTVVEAPAHYADLKRIYGDDDMALVFLPQFAIRQEIL